MNNQIPYNQFDFTEQAFPETVYEQKQSKAKVNEDGQADPVVTYYTCPLLAKLKDETGSFKTIDRILIEGPELTSNGGLVVQKRNGRWETTIFVSFDMKDPEQADFVGRPMDLTDYMKMSNEEKYSYDEIDVTKKTVNRDGTVSEIHHKRQIYKSKIGFCSHLYMELMNRAYPNRDKLGVKGIKNPSGFEGVFKNPIYWKTDVNGSVAEGSNPTRYFKVFCYGDPDKKTTRKAPFSIPAKNSDGEIVLDWNMLTDARVKFIPLIHLKSVYAGGGKLSIQMEIVSAVVTSFERLNSRGEQKDTLEKFRNDDAVVLTLQKQLEAMQVILGKGSKAESETKPKNDDRGSDDENDSKSQIQKLNSSLPKPKIKPPKSSNMELP